MISVYTNLNIVSLYIIPLPTLTFMSNYKTIFMLTWKTCGELKKKEKKKTHNYFLQICT